MTDEEVNSGQGVWSPAKRISTLAVLLVAAVVGVTVYARYDTRASVAFSQADDMSAYVAVVAEYPLTFAARAARGHLWATLGEDRFAALAGSTEAHPSVLGPGLLWFDWLGILLALLASILCLWRRRLTSRGPERLALFAISALALLQVAVLGALPFVFGWLPHWLDTGVLHATEISFHLLAATTVILLTMPVAMHLRRRLQTRRWWRRPTISWQPLLDLYGRTRSSSWEPRTLVWVARLLTHVAVFAAVLWIPTQVWARALPPLLSGDPPTSPDSSIPGLTTTLWGEMRLAVVVLMVVFGIELTRRAWKAARSRHAIEPIVHRGLLLMPVLVMFHRLLSDLARSAQQGDPTMYPIVLYVCAALGMAIGVHLYYILLIHIVDATSKHQRLRGVAIAGRTWFRSRANRWRTSFHAAALLLLLALMYGGTQAPFHQLIPSIHPTRVVLDGPFAFISLETDLSATPEGAGAVWKYATPDRVVDRDSMADASAVQVGVFWVGFAVGYVLEALLACIIVTLYFAFGVAVMGPVMIMLAVIVGIGQTAAAVIDAILVALYIITGWNPGLVSNWLWEGVLGPIFDLVEKTVSLMPLKGVLASIRGAGFQFGMRLVMSLPSFILVAPVLLLVHRKLMKRTGVDNERSPGWLPAWRRGRNRDTCAAESAFEESIEPNPMIGGPKVGEA